MRYPKVLNLGAPYTERTFDGMVMAQEKVDGSQFRWGWNVDGEFYVASKNREIFSDEGMFQLGSQYIRQFKDKPLKDIYFFAEYMRQPKHNALAYDSIPKNYLMLFDVYDQGWLPLHEVQSWSEEFDIDCARILASGQLDVDKVKALLETDSFLGGAKIEGVVIKNYDQLISVGGNIRPLFTKYVSEKFREKHGQEHVPRRVTMESFIKSLKTEARWEKAYQHLLEDGKIQHDLPDIGTIIKEVQRDLEEEELDSIKDFLWEHYRKQIKGTAIAGLPEWYKSKLLDRIEEETNAA